MKLHTITHNSNINTNIWCTVSKPKIL